VFIYTDLLSGSIVLSHFARTAMPFPRLSEINKSQQRTAPLRRDAKTVRLIAEQSAMPDVASE
jgi:hypothetical protein